MYGQLTRSARTVSTARGAATSASRTATRQTGPSEQSRRNVAQAAKTSSWRDVQ